MEMLAFVSISACFYGQGSTNNSDLSCAAILPTVPAALATRLHGGYVLAAVIGVVCVPEYLLHGNRPDITTIYAGKSHALAV